MAEQRASRVFVIWTEPGRACPSDLHDALRRRGIEAVHLDSSHAALAELCAAERPARVHDQDCSLIGLRSVLILSGDDGADRLVSAVERFAPSAHVWIHEPGANPPLRALVVSEDSGAAAAGAGAVEHNAPQQDEADEQLVSSEDTPKMPARGGQRGAFGMPDPEPDQGRQKTPPGLKLATGPSDGTVLGGNAAGVSEPGAIEPARSVRSARDVLDDDELEMLLAGERGSEGSVR